MFTGIVNEVGSVISRLPDQLAVRAGSILKNVELGGSIAVNGACLTVTGFNASSFTVGVVPETWRRTNLGRLKSGDPVNLERPLGLGGELGGHLVEGHVDGTGQIAQIRPEGSANILRVEAAPEILRYVVEKGFVAVEGISLTITAVGADYFELSIIEYTWKNTNLRSHRVGDAVNLEIDILAKYVERLLRAPAGRVSEELLRSNGF